MKFHDKEEQELMESIETDAWVSVDNLENKAQKIKEIQKQWKEIGPVPSNKSEKLWKRFHLACDFFFKNYKKRRG